MISLFLGIYTRVFWTNAEVGMPDTAFLPGDKLGSGALDEIRLASGYMGYR